jgi:hypothetical protein
MNIMKTVGKYALMFCVTASVAFFSACAKSAYLEEIFTSQATIMGIIIFSAHAVIHGMRYIRLAGAGAETPDHTSLEVMIGLFLVVVCSIALRAPRGAPLGILALPEARVFFTAVQLFAVCLLLSVVLDGLKALKSIADAAVNAKPEPQRW